MVLDDKNMWDGILASTLFALGAMVHSTKHYTPAQLVFGTDIILNQWDHKAIMKQKQDPINKRNKCESWNHIKQTYKQGGKALLKKHGRHNQDTYLGS